MIIDLETGIDRDIPTETFIQKINGTTLTGYRYSKGWVNDQRIFFTAIFSKSIKSFSVFDSTVLKQGELLKGSKMKGSLTKSIDGNIAY